MCDMKLDWDGGRGFCFGGRSAGCIVFDMHIHTFAESAVECWRARYDEEQGLLKLEHEGSVMQTIASTYV